MPTVPVGGSATTHCVRLWPRPRATHLPAWADKLTPHVLRHFCASQMYLSGMDLVLVQELLGHAWIATTMRYVHVHSARIEEAWLAGNQRAAQRLKGIMP